MKLSYDAEVDAAYVSLTDAKVVDSEEVRPGIVLDYDAGGRVIGVEILHVRKQRPDIDLSQFEIDAA
ncbi:MAG: DUF2283 domain-containing protein [Phycisphaeraceae bacterium]